MKTKLANDTIAFLAALAAGILISVLPHSVKWFGLNIASGGGPAHIKRKWYIFLALGGTLLLRRLHIKQAI